MSRFPARLESPRGGIEAATVALATALQDREAIDLHVVTLERRLAEVSVERAAGCTVHRLPRSGYPEVGDLWLGPGHRLLVRYLLALAPDLVHSHETYGLGLTSLPMPHVMTVHGFDHLNLVADGARLAWLRAPLWKWVTRCGLSKQQTVVSVNPYARRLIESYTTAEIHDIENPIDERFFGDLHRHEFARRERVLCAGWICERKNTIGAIETFRAAVCAGAPGTLVIAGAALDSSYMKRVRNRISEFGLGGRVELVGSLGRGELLVELGRSRALLLPSRQETAPLVIAEAMAAGVPTVASNRCGIPFMVRDGETGFLIDPDDPDHSGERLARLLTDDRLAEEMGERGRAEAAGRFHPRQAARRTLELYRSLCPDPS